MAHWVPVPFFQELKRRNVIRVATAYVVVAWLVIQVAETIFPLYGFDDAPARVITTLLAIGFIPALVLAWAFELTPEGLKRDSQVDPAAAVRPGAGKRLDRLIMVALALALGFFAFDKFVLDPVEDDEIAAMARQEGRLEALSESWGDNTIAVLPFVTLGAEAPDVFTDGMHVGVITRLSNVVDLNVISRTSVLAYRDSGKPLRELAAELGAAWVLRADVQQGENAVQVSVQLADARGDRQVWAQDYQRDLSTGSIFDIQADIAHNIIDALETRLTAQEQSRIETVPTANLEAYRAYQMGRDQLDRRTPDAMRRSVDYFETAVGLDPDYALAWTGLADALTMLVAYAYESDPVFLQRAKAGVSRALQLDPDQGEAWAVRAMLHYVGRDGPATLEAIDRAVALSPSHAQAWTWRAFFYGLFGDNETSHESASRALALNPLSAEAIANFSSSAVHAGNQDAALREARRARQEVAPDWPNTRLVLGMVQYQLGMYEAAASELEGVSLPWTGAGAETLRCLALLALGDEDRALAQFETIQASGDAYAVATIQAALGNRDAAYQALEAIERLQDFQTLSFRYDHRPIWDPQGKDPRYREAIARINTSWGLPPEGL